jgi:hypothetical protein
MQGLHPPSDHFGKNDFFVVGSGEGPEAQAPKTMQLVIVPSVPVKPVRMVSEVMRIRKLT